MRPADPRFILPEPPEALKAMSRELVSRMRARWREDGRLSFADYMEMALYEPGLGYYSAGLAKFGEEGDFITAPELGSLFGRCLARQVREVADVLSGRQKREAADGPAGGQTAPGPETGWNILEIGAGSGRLAADVLEALSADGGRLPERYWILERSADLRAVQARTLEDRVPALTARVEWLDQPPARAWRGVLLANEVIDALAVERFHLTGAGIDQSGVHQSGVDPRNVGQPNVDELSIDQLGVRFDDERPAWDRWPADGPLAERVNAVRADLPEALSAGYESELCLTLPAWLATVTRGLDEGVALFIDYGYPRSVYYHPERRGGTLVCHYRHRAHFDPFTWPGLQDLTAFVDFTAVAEAADAAGLTVAGYAPQNLFLFGCGLDTMAAALPDLPPQERQALAHELRELTLPGAMGEKFQVMALTRNYDATLGGFAHGDWLDRL